MARHKPKLTRTVHIELLRARAALEREELVENFVAARESLRPSSIMRGIWPKVSAVGKSRSAAQIFTLLRRYPVLMSAASALVMGKGRLAILTKAGGGAWLAFKAYSVWREHARQSGEAAAIRENRIPP